MTVLPATPMEQARKNLSELGHRALANKTTTLVTSHGRLFFAICPPEGAMLVATLDQKLRDAVTAGDDTALAHIAEQSEQAGLPLLAALLRAHKTAGLRALLDTEYGP